MVSLVSPEWAYIEQRQPMYTLKNLVCFRNSFQKLSQDSKENRVLDADVLILMVFFGVILVFLQLS
jgi:hypothetical protein